MPRATPREIRLNLMVLAAILILVTPGAILLVKKKSKPGARPIGAADVVINTTAFMDPYAGPGVERLAPLTVVRWTQSLLPEGSSPLTPTTNPTRLIRRKSSTVGSEIPLPEFDLVPVATVPTSEGHYLQVLSQTPGEARLLLWSDAPEMSVAVNEGLRRKSTHEVPKEIRHILQNVGFVDPPARVMLLEVDASPGRTIEVVFGKASRDVIRLP